MGARWRYIHARTVARVWPRLKRPVTDESPAVERFLRETIESHESFSILQVGAYDGVSNDPVHDLLRRYPQVRAVLLEPQPGPYAALDALWTDQSRVVRLRCALAAECGERPLYVVSAAHKRLHPFADQIASFSRSYVEAECSRYVWRPSEDSVASVAVPTIDWRTLARKHGPFDFVTIDAEGFDGEILHLMDFAEAPPAIILYEHRHLTRKMRERCVRRLEQQGYTLTRVNKADTLATRLPQSAAHHRV